MSYSREFLIVLLQVKHLSYLTNFYVIFALSAFSTGKVLCCKGYKKEGDMRVTFKKLKGLNSNRRDKIHTHSTTLRDTQLCKMSFSVVAGRLKEES